MTSRSSSGVVAWADTDASGRFHFTAPLRWVENAEHAMYRAGVPGIDIGRFPRRSIESTFERSLIAGDEYRVEFTSVQIGRTSLSYSWQVVGSQGTAVVGRHVAVHVDAAGMPAPVPSELRAALEAEQNSDAGGANGTGS